MPFCPACFSTFHSSGPLANVPGHVAILLQQLDGMEDVPAELIMKPALQLHNFAHELASSSAQLLPITAGDGSLVLEVDTSQRVKLGRPSLAWNDLAPSTVTRKLSEIRKVLAAIGISLDDLASYYRKQGVPIPKLSPEECVRLALEINITDSDWEKLHQFSQVLHDYLCGRTTLQQVRTKAKTELETKFDIHIDEATESCSTDPVKVALYLLNKEKPPTTAVALKMVIDGSDARIQDHVWLLLQLLWRGSKQHHWCIWELGGFRGKESTTAYKQHNLGAMLSGLFQLHGTEVRRSDGVLHSLEVTTSSDLHSTWYVLAIDTAPKGKAAKPQQKGEAADDGDDGNSDDDGDDLQAKKLATCKRDQKQDLVRICPVCNTTDLSTVGEQRTEYPGALVQFSNIFSFMIICMLHALLRLADQRVLAIWVATRKLGPTGKPDRLYGEPVARALFHQLHLKFWGKPTKKTPNRPHLWMDSRHSRKLFNPAVNKRLALFEAHGNAAEATKIERLWSDMFDMYEQFKAGVNEPNEQQQFETFAQGVIQRFRDHYGAKSVRVYNHLIAFHGMAFQRNHILPAGAYANQAEENSHHWRKQDAAHTMGDGSCKCAGGTKKYTVVGQVLFRSMMRRHYHGAVRSFKRSYHKKK